MLGLGESNKLKPTYVDRNVCFSTVSIMEIVLIIIVKTSSKSIFRGGGANGEEQYTTVLKYDLMLVK